ncbi:hypothetical protein [Nostoc sphaeroides]|nr:hypothetical protein [Nostoc sphaeroides]
MKKSLLLLKCDRKLSKAYLVPSLRLGMPVLEAPPQELAAENIGMVLI